MEITGSRIPSSPSLSDINDVIMRILETTDLSVELETIGVDIRRLAEQIAWAQCFKKRWDQAHASMVKARIHADNIGYTYLRRKQSKQRRSRLTFIAARITKDVAAEKAAIIKRSQTKKRPYVVRLATVLECILSEKTDKPYRYMAALFNLFNLRPEKGCDKCPRSDKARCRAEIFSCIEYETTRQTLWKIVRSGKYSPNLQARLKKS